MKKMIGIGLLVFVLSILTACGGTSSDSGSSTKANDSKGEMNRLSERADESRKEAKENSSSSVGSSKDSQESDSLDSSHDEPKVVKSSEDKGIAARKKAVFEAVLRFDLNFEKKKEDTKVEYESETVTWGGQKVRLEIVSGSDHQDDFKAGIVKAVSDTEGKTVMTYHYKIDEQNKLSLIETLSLNGQSYETVVYATYIGEDSDIHISSGDAAIEYLKQQIKAGSNSDIVFGDMGGKLDSDRIGSYYSIRLISKTMRENGGTGTVNIYNVYQDGTYLPNT